MVIYMYNDYGGIPIKSEYKSKLYGNNIKQENNNKKKKKKKITKKILNILIIFFLIITCSGIYMIVEWNKDNINTSKLVDEINKEVEVVEKVDTETTEIIGAPEEEETNEPEVVSDYWYYVRFPLIDVDISSLKQKNSDTVGWINVNNTNINYPYVQTSDNKYYLDHSFNKTYNDAGWVFLDYRNNSNLDNKNTIIYAHSRLDKTMFGSLSKVFRADWHTNKDNHIIRISTETENTLWQIFSVYKIAEESYYITTEFRNDDKYVEFLNTIEGRSIYNFNTSLSANDKILTLSTCYDDNIRTVVHAKLIKRSVKE